MSIDMAMWLQRNGLALGFWESAVAIALIIGACVWHELRRPK